MNTARAFLLEDAPVIALGKMPARCAHADELRFEWFRMPVELQYFYLGALTEHMRTCLQCLRRNAWFSEAARRAEHPDLTAEQMEGA